MADVTLYLRGDQIATYFWAFASGNGTDRILTVVGVTAIGSASQIYTVLVEQVAEGGSEFANGQFVTITDSLGVVVVPRTNIQPDAEQGLAAGDEHLLIGWPQFLIDLGGVPAGPATVIYGSGDETADPGAGDNDGNLDFADFPCFTPGTMIATPGGPRDVATLAAGDLVATLDHGPQPLRWAGKRTLAFSSLPHPRQPILLPKSALGPLLPDAPMRVSPQHRMVLSGTAVRETCGEDMVFVPAKALVTLPGVRAMQGRSSETYISLLFDRHEILWANGCLSESFYPGKVGMRMLGADNRRAVQALFPRLLDDPENGYGPLARRSLAMREARALVGEIKPWLRDNAGKVPAFPPAQDRLAS